VITIISASQVYAFSVHGIIPASELAAPHDHALALLLYVFATKQTISPLVLADTCASLLDEKLVAAWVVIIIMYPCAIAGAGGRGGVAKGLA
jgi:hypothetical protein